jgi:ferrous iron transport protein A
MFTQKFSVCFSCLEMLNPREKGVISHVRSNDTILLKKLKAMGVEPGLSITVEKCFPAFAIKVGKTRLTLDREMARSIYVKLAES